MITIRIALNTDIEEIQSLYRNTVLVINRRDYSQAEVEDWASCGDDPSKIEGCSTSTIYPRFSKKWTGCYTHFRGNPRNPGCDGITFYLIQQ